MRCYFCNQQEKIILQKRVLWNGKEVQQCVYCFKCLETGLKVAQERGHYDPEKIALLYDRGGDRVKVTKGETGGNNLKASFVEEKKITKVKIADEGRYVTYEPKNPGEKKTTKLVIGVSYDGQIDSDPSQWSMNNKSLNALIDVWTDDTTQWIGKEAEINLEGVGEYRHIVVDTLRTK